MLTIDPLAVRDLNIDFSLRKGGVFGHRVNDYDSVFGGLVKDKDVFRVSLDAGGAPIGILIVPGHPVQIGQSVDLRESSVDGVSA